MSKVLLAETTSAGNSSAVTLRGDGFLPTSFSAPGLGAGEAVKLQYTVDEGATWHDYYEDEEATPKSITTNNSFLTIYGSGVWRAVKTITTSAVAIYLHTASSP